MHPERVQCIDSYCSSSEYSFRKLRFSATEKQNLGCQFNIFMPPESSSLGDLIITICSVNCTIIITIIKKRNKIKSLANVQQQSTAQRKFDGKGGGTTEKAATFEMFHKNLKTSLPMTTAPVEIKSAKI